MTDDAKKPSPWEEIKRVAEEVRLQIHLAGMGAKEKWNELTPKIAEVQQDLEREGSEIGDKLNEKLASLKERLKKLKAEIEKPV